MTDRADSCLDCPMQCMAQARDNPNLGGPNPFEPGGNQGIDSDISSWLRNTGQYDFRIGSGVKVLEVGVGKKRLVPGSTTVSNDPAMDADEICDIRTMPFKDKEFDVCIAHEVFCRNDRQMQLEMLAEVVRVSRTTYLRQWKACVWHDCGFKFSQGEFEALQQGASIGELKPQLEPRVVSEDPPVIDYYDDQGRYAGRGEMIGDEWRVDVPPPARGQGFEAVIAAEGLAAAQENPLPELTAAGPWDGVENPVPPFRHTFTVTPEAVIDAWRAGLGDSVSARVDGEDGWQVLCEVMQVSSLIVVKDPVEDALKLACAVAYRLCRGRPFTLGSFTAAAAVATSLMGHYGHSLHITTQQLTTELESFSGVPYRSEDDFCSVLSNAFNLSAMRRHSGFRNNSLARRFSSSVGVSSNPSSSGIDSEIFPEHISSAIENPAAFWQMLQENPAGQTVALYHGTTSKFRSRIKREGFTIGSWFSTADQPELPGFGDYAVRRFGGKEIDVWRFDVPVGELRKAWLIQEQDGVRWYKFHHKPHGRATLLRSEMFEPEAEENPGDKQWDFSSYKLHPAWIDKPGREIRLGSKLFRGTSSVHLTEEGLFAHAPWKWKRPTPRIYLSEGEEDAASYAPLEVEWSGGEPVLCEITLDEDLFRELRPGDEAEGEWYVERDFIRREHVRCRSVLRSEENPTGPSGTCQVCFKRQKTRDGLMVLHGYQRPGHGYIVGECWGVSYPPFEISAERTQAFLDELQRIKRQKEEHLHKLQANEYETLLYVPYWGGYGTKKPSVQIAKGAKEDFREHIPSFEEHRRNLIFHAEQDIKHLSSDVQTYSKAIADWKPVPWPPEKPEPGKKKYSQHTALDTFDRYAASKGYTQRVQTGRSREFLNAAGERIIMWKARGGRIDVYEEKAQPRRYYIPYEPEPQENPPMVKAYHGTTQENAQKILTVGFVIADSYEMFLGRGVYLSKSPEKAAEYGDVVLEVGIPVDLIGEGSNIEGIGTFDQFEEDVRRSRMYLGDDEDPEDVDIWKLYRQIASNRAEDLGGDSPVMMTETQIVVYDPELARQLGMTAKIVSLTPSGDQMNPVHLPSGITIRNEVRDYYSGQLVGTLYALDDTGHVVGHLDWSYYDREPYIDMVEVDLGHRKRGVGLALVSKLVEEMPGQVHWGVTTEEGTALREAWERPHPSLFRWLETGEVGWNPKVKEALIIVHLSSLDSYTDQVGSSQGEELATNILYAILEHKGPVYIVDQGWETGHRESLPRERLLKRIEPRQDIVWIHFDEAEDDWLEFIQNLQERIEADKITHVVLGGLWYTPSLKEGCVTEVLTQLRGFRPVRVDDMITGCVEELEEAEWEGEVKENPQNIDWRELKKLIGLRDYKAAEDNFIGTFIEEDEDLGGEEYSFEEDKLRNEFRSLTWKLQEVPLEPLQYAPKQDMIRVAKALDQFADSKKWEVAHFRKLKSAPAKAREKPIVVVENIVVDGYHRVALAVADGKKTIWAYTAVAGRGLAGLENPKKKPAKKKEQAAACPLPILGPPQDTFEIEKVEYIDSIVDQMETFRNHLLVERSTGRRFIINVEPWESVCLDHLYDDAVEHCGGDEDQDCVDRYLGDAVPGEADRIVGEEGWDGYWMTYKIARFGESVFYKEVGKARHNPFWRGRSVELHHSPAVSESAHARVRSGTIYVGPKYQELTSEGKRVTLEHELGHVLSDWYPEITSRAIDARVLGRWDPEKERYISPLDERTPEEAWATAFGWYVGDPVGLAKAHPDVYAFMESVLLDYSGYADFAAERIEEFVAAEKNPQAWTRCHCCGAVWLYNFDVYKRHWDHRTIEYGWPRKGIKRRLCSCSGQLVPPEQHDPTVAKEPEPLEE